MTRVAVTDDDAGIRKVVRHTLHRQPEMEFLWEPQDGLDALQRTDAAEPDVARRQPAVPIAQPRHIPSNGEAVARHHRNTPN